MSKRERYQLPEEDCERLERSELAALKMMLAELSSGTWVRDELKNRLPCIPYGRQRLLLALGVLRAVCDDMIGTIPVAQAKQIMGTLKDYEIRLIPKLTPNSTNIILTREEAKDLMDMARERCSSCVEDGESCRQCKLYQLLEATTPLNDYGNGLTCPYALAEWE